jgi:two-component system response regulator
VAYDHPEPFILLVEDSEDDELLTLRALKGILRPCPVTTARDGESAIACLEGGPLPALILLDLKLPKLTGFQVLAHLRALRATQHLPVVVLTSSNETVDVREAYRLGANSYIQKPVDFNSFIDTVRLVGNYWLDKNIAYAD